MRILLVNWQDRENPQAGGAEIHLHEIFGRLAARGHEVRLLCGGWPGCPPRALLDGIDVHRVGTRHTFPFFAHRYYSRHLARWARHPRRGHQQGAALHAALGRAARPSRSCRISSAATAFPELAAPLAAAVWLAERPLGRVYRGVPFEAISESTADDLAARGIPRAPVKVIYPGDRHRRLHADRRRARADAGVRVPRPPQEVQGRGPRDPRVRRDGRRLPAATLEIAGAGDYRPALEALARSLDLGERVRFLGRISEEEKLALLRRAWALVFASPKEGWGITNLEAAACATPVVASNSPGIRESVRDGDTGSSCRTATSRDGRRDAAPRRVARARGAPRGGRARLRRDVHLGARGGGDRGASHARRSARSVRNDAVQLTVGRLFERMKDALQLEPVDGAAGLDREVESPNVSSPGLVLAGYVGRFRRARVQVLGETEVTYLKSLDSEVRLAAI